MSDQPLSQEQLQQATQQLMRELLGFITKEPHASVAICALFSATAYVAHAANLQHTLPRMFEGTLDIVNRLQQQTQGICECPACTGKRAGLH